MDDWQYFRKRGTAQELAFALERLQEQGWVVLEDPEQDPAETWTVRVRRPVSPVRLARHDLVG